MASVRLSLRRSALASIREHVPDPEGKIVFNRYHLMTYMVKAVDEVRKEEHRLLQKEGQETLTGTKYLWLYSRENVPNKKCRLFSVLRQLRLRTARAWASDIDIISSLSFV